MLTQLTSFFTHLFTLFNLPKLISSDLTQEHPFFLFIKYGIIPLLLFGIVITISLLLVNHYLHLEIMKRKSSVERATDEILTKLLFWHGTFEDMGIAVAEFKYAVPYKKRWCRQFVLERILLMKQNFQLDDTILLDIYKLFEFEKITYDLLRHKKWHKRSLGIYQLQFMHDVAKRKQLHLLLNEKNTEVKSNALITLVTFSEERFAILSNYEKPLSKADEIKIMDIIYHSTPLFPPNTTKLLKSENTSIVVLGIKLMALYKRPFSQKQAIKLVRLSNFRIRKEAIKAIGKLKYVEANDMLMSQYSIEMHKQVKINILVSLKNIGNMQTVEFLKTLLKKEKDASLKFKIVHALFTLVPDFFDGHEYDNSYDAEIKSMALHVKDPYLV